MKKQRKEKFIDELIKLCKKHGLSLAHEDSQGSFIIEEYSDENIQWVKEALDYD